MNEREQKTQKNAKDFEFCEKLITVKMAANLLGVSPMHIRNLIKSKKLRAAQVGAHKQPMYRIAESDLLRFIRAAKRSAGVKKLTHEKEQKKAAEMVEKIKNRPPGVGSFENAEFSRGAAAGSHTSAISPDTPHSTSNADTHNLTSSNE